MPPTTRFSYFHAFFDAARQRSTASDCVFEHALPPLQFQCGGLHTPSMIGLSVVSRRSDAKRNWPILFALLFSTLNLQPSAFVQAATTIDPANRYAYGANVGWLDLRGDTSQRRGHRPIRLLRQHLFGQRGLDQSRQRLRPPMAFITRTIPAERLRRESGRPRQFARLCLWREHRLDQLRGHRRAKSGFGHAAI